MTEHLNRADQSIIAQFANFKIIPVIVIDQPEDILPLGEILMAHNLPVAEITFRTAAAAEAITLLKTHYPQMLVGAGTVSQPQVARIAQEAGADFIVSPGFNPQTVEACQKLDIAIIPGVNNPTSIEAALNMGLDLLKFFPAEASGGVQMIKALVAPYQHIAFMPTGGINNDNIQHYLAIEQVVACGMSAIVEPKLIKTGQWKEIAARIATTQQLLQQ